MNYKLLKTIILSKKSCNEIVNLLKCSVDDFIDKLLGIKSFDEHEINLMIKFIPITNPIDIFFNNDVS